MGPAHERTQENGRTRARRSNVHAVLHGITASYERRAPRAARRQKERYRQANVPPARRTRRGLGKVHRVVHRAHTTRALLRRENIHPHHVGLRRRRSQGNSRQLSQLQAARARHDRSGVRPLHEATNLLRGTRAHLPVLVGRLARLPANRRGGGDGA